MGRCGLLLGIVLSSALAHTNRRRSRFGGVRYRGAQDRALMLASSGHALLGLWRCSRVEGRLGQDALRRTESAEPKVSPERASTPPPPEPRRAHAASYGHCFGSGWALGPGRLVSPMPPARLRVWQDGHGPSDARLLLATAATPTRRASQTLPRCVPLNVPPGPKLAALRPCVGGSDGREIECVGTLTDGSTSAYLSLLMICSGVCRLLLTTLALSCVQVIRF